MEITPMTTQKTPHSFITSACVLLCAGVISLAATAGAAPTDSDVLASLSSQGITKGITELAANSQTLADKAKQYCEQKDDASLAEAREAWKKAYISWCWLSPFKIGPMKEMQLYKRIGLWRSNDIIFKGITTSPDFKAMLKAPELRGFAASEWILFASEKPSAETACGHLVDVASEIAELSAQAQKEWGEKSSEFVNAGDGMPYMMESEAMSPVVAEALNTTETMLRDRIGLPSNFFKGEAKTELLEAYHSKTTGKGLQATLDGLKTVLDGGAPASILELLATKDGLVNKKNPKLAKAIRKNLDNIQKMLNKITAEKEPLAKQIADDPATMKKVYKKLQKLEEQLLELSLGLELDVKAGLEAQILRQE
ncbi:MAG: hypothetical protein CSA26_08635 [Desulfobacterales bacterium]|nr:MAG: hypothetical protein CSA26_08635 [Desulfobacterales bacterium]